MAHRREWVLLVGVLVVATIAALPILTYPLGRDQGEGRSNAAAEEGRRKWAGPAVHREV